MKIDSTLKLLPALFLLCLTPPSLTAANFTWTGNADSNYANQANWGDGISGAPTTVTDWGIFNDPATPGTVTIPASTTLTTNVEFDTAGWTLDPINTNNSVLQIRGSSGAPSTPIISNGAGVNTISARTNFFLGSSVQVGTGNTLVFSSINNRNSITQTGAGTMIVNGTYSSGTAGIGSDGGTVLVNTSFNMSGQRPFAKNGGSLGGTGTLIMGGTSTGNYQVRIAEDGIGTLSPGGNGTAEGGADIGTFTVDFSSVENGSSIITMYDDAILAIDLASPASHDLLNITTGDGVTVGGYMLLTNADTLDLSGPITPVAGDYTFVTMENPGNITSSAYGTFDSIFYNGVDVTANPSFSLAYNLNDITLTIIPEPSFYALCGGLIILSVSALRRRRV